MKRILIVLFCLSLTSCALLDFRPSYYKQNKQVSSITWEKVAILPFSGKGANPMVDKFWPADWQVKMATSHFSRYLQKQGEFMILPEEVVNWALKDSGFSMPFTIQEAQKVGQLLEVDAVLLGIVSWDEASGYAIVKLIDVKSGEVIAESRRPDKLWLPLNAQQCVIQAAENSAKDMLKVFKKLKYNTVWQLNNP